jgi:hypothetical protein
LRNPNVRYRRRPVNGRILNQYTSRLIFALTAKFHLILTSPTGHTQVLKISLHLRFIEYDFVCISHSPEVYYVVFLRHIPLESSSGPPFRFCSSGCDTCSLMFIVYIVYLTILSLTCNVHCQMVEW